MFLTPLGDRPNSLKKLKCIHYLAPPFLKVEKIEMYPLFGSTFPKGGKKLKCIHLWERWSQTHLKIEMFLTPLGDRPNNPNPNPNP